VLSHERKRRIYDHTGDDGSSSSGPQRRQQQQQDQQQRMREQWAQQRRQQEEAARRPWYGGPGSLVTPITQGNYKMLTRKRRGSTVWVLEFYTKWCGPCHHLKNHLERLAHGFQQREVRQLRQGQQAAAAVNVGAVDCEADKGLCEKYGIRGYPTILLLSEAACVETFQGTLHYQAVERFVVRRLEGGAPLRAMDSLAAWLLNSTGADVCDEFANTDPAVLAVMLCVLLPMLALALVSSCGGGGGEAEAAARGTQRADAELARRKEKATRLAGLRAGGAGEGGEGGAGGHGDEALRVPEPPPHTADELRAVLVAYYSRHNPLKARSVDAVVAHYQRQERGTWRMAQLLEDKYGERLFKGGGGREDEEGGGDGDSDRGDGDCGSGDSGGSGGDDDDDGDGEVAEHRAQLRRRVPRRPPTPDVD
jgi:thiol-disulfide isomerase/thioredoxin